MCLVKYFNNNKLITDIGTFSFVKQIGEGGNGIVLKFKRENTYYAVKFLSAKLGGDKINRFIDEFFCTIKIPEHKNISKIYHFDKISINNSTYYILIMKYYDGSLKSVHNKQDSEKSNLGKKLLKSLCAGLKHLHSHDIIHRDLKPENIFLDSQANNFVIGDMGIASFPALLEPLAHTEPTDRLANFKFSAPEQVQKNGHVHATWDIYALGQVLSWYLFNTLIKGTNPQRYFGSNTELELLDDIIYKCVQNNAANRFQNIDEIIDYLESNKVSEVRIWDRLYALDNAIRASFPDIKDRYLTTDVTDINRFLKNFCSNCNINEFYYILSNGGDNALTRLNYKKNGRWIINNYFELKVSKLFLFKDVSVFRSLFILFVDKDEIFEYVNIDGSPYNEKDINCDDFCYSDYFRKKYLKPDLLANGYYYDPQGKVRSVKGNSCQHRLRFLKNDVIMIVPQLTGALGVPQSVNEDFLTLVCQLGEVPEIELTKYLKNILCGFSNEIMSYL